MILKFTAVLLACVLGASLGRPMEKRDATATPCVDYTAKYRQPNYILLESVKRLCTAAKDLDNFIDITVQQCPYPLANNPEAVIGNTQAFDEVVKELQKEYLSKISHAIKYGQNITECITVENEKLRFNISSKLAHLQNTVQEMMTAGCKAENSGLACGNDKIYPSTAVHSSINSLSDYKCLAKFGIAAAIRFIVEKGRDHDWFFGSVGCR